MPICNITILAYYLYVYIWKYRRVTTKIYIEINLISIKSKSTIYEPQMHEHCSHYLIYYM